MTGLQDYREVWQRRRRIGYNALNAAAVYAPLDHGAHTRQVVARATRRQLPPGPVGAFFLSAVCAHASRLEHVALLGRGGLLVP